LQAKVTPPSNAKIAIQNVIAILPYNSKRLNRVFYTYCKACSDGGIMRECKHTDEERSWTGTFFSGELQFASTHRGYKYITDAVF